LNKDCPREAYTIGSKAHKKKVNNSNVKITIASRKLKNSKEKAVKNVA